MAKLTFEQSLPMTVGNRRSLSRGVVFRLILILIIATRVRRSRWR
jgi:hypothetical protein